VLSISSQEKIMKKTNDGYVFEVLRKQGETLSNILKVIREFRNMDFSSKDVKNRYEERIGKPIQLSTVATYLMRLHDKGFLVRRKRGREYIYQAATILLKNE
jgi:predicted transcriptional regulator